MKILKSVISRINNWFYYKKIPSIVDWLVSLSLVEARKKIQQRSATRILVDNSVIAHGVTHETFWKSKGEHAWGDSKLTTGHIARLPVYDEADDNRVARNVRYLGPITHLAMEGTLQFFSSPELDDERFRQPFGRYRGYGLLDYTLFRRVSIGRLEDMSFCSSWSYVRVRTH